MSVASRKLHEEARRCLLALTRALRDFDECERAFYQACELPDVERSNRERREGRAVSKALAHTNPARERTFEALVAAFKAVTRQRAMIHAWEDEPLLRDIWEELSAARADADRCLERHVNAQAEHKTKTFSRARLARNEELTPEERARGETRDWVQAAVKSLREQVDEIEAEAEALGEGRAGKKEKEAGAARFAALLRAHRAHEAKLEKLTRLLDNEIVEPEEADALRDDVESYVADARADTGAGDFESTLEIYDAIAALAPRAEDDEEGEGEEEEEEAEPDEAAAEVAAAGGGGGGGGGAIKRAAASKAPRVPAAMIVPLCIVYAKLPREAVAGSRTCYNARCELDHDTVDRARAINACSFHLVRACTRGAACRQQHMGREEVLAASAHIADPRPELTPAQQTWASAGAAAASAAAAAGAAAASAALAAPASPPGNAAMSAAAATRLPDFPLLPRALTPPQPPELPPPQIAGALARIAAEAHRLRSLRRGHAHSGAPAPSDSNDALLAAARAGDLVSTQLLLAAGAHASARDRGGRSALLWALLRRHEGVALELIARGADVDARDAGCRSPIGAAALFGLERAALALLASGADARGGAAPGAAAELPLHVACAFGRAGVALLLLACGGWPASARVRSETGSTPIALLRALGGPAEVQLAPLLLMAWLQTE
jgi:hypothetical protein